MEKRIIIIGGSTASGKSALAMLLAQKINSVIINADSMQVYREIPIITAQPTAAEQKAVPHELYGILPEAERCSAGKWLEIAHTSIERTFAAGKTPILVGGSGLYIKSLLHGIAEIPRTQEEIRKKAQLFIREKGLAALYEDLKNKDPKTASSLHPDDIARISRAWEVMEQTGTPLSKWRKQGHKGLYPPEIFKGFFLNPPREEVYNKVNERFAAMVENGALKEAENLRAQNLDPTLPAMKAHGIPELIAHLNGQISIEEAIAKAQQNTRNYVKRQITWFRHQLPELEETEDGRLWMIDDG